VLSTGHVRCAPLEIPMKNPTSSPPGAARVAAIYLGPHNAEAVIGLPWRRVRDHARELGVPMVRVGKALLVPADLFAAAAQARGTTAPAPADAAQTELDPATAIRERLGVRRLA
jgi:hypothetical protein